MTQLSAHFTLREFTRSETAARMGRTIEVTPTIVANLEWLCVQVLEPIRLAVGPLYVLSGYRPLWLNQAVGGATKSDHMEGFAADVESPTLSPLQLCERIIPLMSKLPIEKLILEFPPNGWAHISASRPAMQPARHVLTARKLAHGATQYQSGLWRSR